MMSHQRWLSRSERLFQTWLSSRPPRLTSRQIRLTLHAIRPDDSRPHRVGAGWSDPADDPIFQAIVRKNVEMLGVSEVIRRMALVFRPEGQ